jgi:hypothetical protein
VGGLAGGLVAGFAARGGERLIAIAAGEGAPGTTFGGEIVGRFTWACAESAWMVQANPPPALTARQSSNASAPLLKPHTPHAKGHLPNKGGTVRR